MELTQKGRRFLYLILVGAAVLVGIIYLVSRSNPPAQAPFGAEVPNEFRGELPVLNDNYAIEYLAEIDTYSVTIYGEPTDRYKEEARKYLEKNGANLSRSKIEYTVPEELPGWSDEN